MSGSQPAQMTDNLIYAGLKASFATLEGAAPGTKFEFLYVVTEEFEANGQLLAKLFVAGTPENVLDWARTQDYVTGELAVARDDVGRFAIVLPSDIPNQEAAQMLANTMADGVTAVTFDSSPPCSARDGSPANPNAPPTPDPAPPPAPPNTPEPDPDPDENGGDVPPAR